MANVSISQVIILYKIYLLDNNVTTLWLRNQKFEKSTSTLSRNTGM